MQLIDACMRHRTVERDPRRCPTSPSGCELYRDQSGLFVEQLLRVCRVDGDVVVVDLRDEDTIHAGNRFMVYALFPQARVSVHVMWGKQQQNTVLAVGRSILDRTLAGRHRLGDARYGGGGHPAAGTCQVAHADADRVLAEVLDEISPPLVLAY